MAKSYGKIYQNKSNVSITPFDIYNLYPVGSIYMSVNSTNPSNYFGGTWQQIKGRFLLGAGLNESNTTNYWGTYNAGTCNFPAGEMSGEVSHVLSLNEMPAHTHGVNYWLNYNLPGGWDKLLAYGNSNGTPYNVKSSDWINNEGGNQPHNNMPPYLVVYMWKRVA